MLAGPLTSAAYDDGVVAVTEVNTVPGHSGIHGDLEREPRGIERLDQREESALGLRVKCMGRVVEEQND